MQCKLSLIIPVFNESDCIQQCLNELQELRQQGHEVIVVDGGSRDNTVSLATALSDTVIHAKKSRAIQMNAGAQIATGDYFLFLHADTKLPDNVSRLFLKIKKHDDKWGRFDIKLSGNHFLFRIIEKCMNIRSRLTSIATGDQVIFVHKELFNQIEGFPQQTLMEDIAISKLLSERFKPVCLKENVVSSSRRWEQNGIVKTIIRMWFLRLLYYFDYDTNKLAKMYS